MTQHVDSRVPASFPRLRARLSTWLANPDNARTDFRVIALFNLAVGAVLLFIPALAHSSAFTVLMHLIPGAGNLHAFWGCTFVAGGALGLGGLCAEDERSAGKLRHYAWLVSGTLLVMWTVGVLEATGSIPGVLLLALALAWYTLTAARLELPRVLRR